MEGKGHLVLQNSKLEETFTGEGTSQAAAQ